MKPSILLLLILSSLPSNAMNVGPVPVEVRDKTNSRGMTPRGYHVPIFEDVHPRMLEKNIERQLSFFRNYLRDRKVREQTVDMRS